MPSLLSSLRTAREYVTPTLKSSAFLTKGVLTPEEFIAAGDELVFKCPTWSWEAGDPSKRKKHLPKDKQYLITRNVPCSARVSSLENVVAVENNMPGGCDGNDDDDWLVSQILTEEEQKLRAEEALMDEFDILDDDGETLVDGSVEKEVAKLSLADEKGNESTKADTTTAAKEEEEDEDDEYADMAGELGYAKAYVNIGCAYQDGGKGVKVDKKMMIHYFELAAMGGDPHASFNLGIDEAKSGNMDRALKHFMLSTREGYPHSLKSIKLMYENGDATKEDYMKALQAYQAYLGEIKSDQRDKAAAANEEFRYY